MLKTLRLAPRDDTPQLPNLTQPSPSFRGAGGSILPAQASVARGEASILPAQASVARGVLTATSQATCHDLSAGRGGPDSSSAEMHTLGDSGDTMIAIQEGQVDDMECPSAEWQQASDANDEHLAATTEPCPRPCRHVVLLLDAGSSSATTVCDLVAPSGASADTLYRCTEPATKAPVLLRRVPRLCESLTVDEEVAQALLLLQEADDAPAVKLILVVEYPAIQMGASVFSLLVERVATLLGDVRRFGDAFGLVCTKVPAASSWKPESGQGSQDHGVKAEVAALLGDTLRGLEEGRLGRHLEGACRARCVALVSALVSEAHARVALVRCPDEAHRDEQADDLQRLLWEATRWQSLLPCDVVRAMPLWSRPNIARRVQQLQEAVAAEVAKAVALSEAHVEAVLQASKDTAEGLALLRKLWEDGDGWCNVAAVRGVVDEVHGLLAELKRLQFVIQEDEVSKTEQLVKNREAAVKEFGRFWVAFFMFLDELAEYLWAYDVQCRRWAFDVRDVEDWGRGGGDRGLVVTTENVQSFLRLLDKKSGLKTCSVLAGAQLRPLMLERLNDLIGGALRHEVAVSRRGDEVVVTGVCVVLSNVLQSVSQHLGPFRQSVAEDRYQVAPALTSSAPSAATSVVLLAQDTVFLDREWDAGAIKLAVVAPRWHVVAVDHLGGPAILLNGASATNFREAAERGKDASAPSTPTGDSTDPDPALNLEPSKGGGCGTPGRAGGAGQAAGTFFGVAMEIVHSHLLTVSACGGDGAKGQDGGAGGDGEPGKDAVGGFLYNQPKASKLGDVTSIVTLAFNQRSRKFHGTPGGKGGKGGAGGRGGAAGPCGELVIMSPRSKPSVRLVAEDGKPGADGAGGEGGQGGLNGRDCTGTLSLVLFVPVADTTVYDDKPPGNADKGDVGAPGGSSRGCRPGQLQHAEQAVALEEHEKDAVVQAFIEASRTGLPRTLPSQRRQTSEELLRHVQRGWRLQHWYQLRTGRAASSDPLVRGSLAASHSSSVSSDASSGSSFYTMPDSDLTSRD